MRGKNIVRACHGALLAAACCTALLSCADAGKQLAKVPLPPSAQVINNFDMTQLDKRFEPPLAYAVASGKPRGITALKIFPTVAPAVVVVKLFDGHGTGFVIDKDGWIVTNNHVARHAVPDSATGAQTVEILFGRMDGNWMHLITESVTADVYKVDKDIDLALLKIRKKPADLASLTSIPFATKDSSPGAECVAIGHPASNSLWSVRTGEVTGSAIWPDEQIDIMLERVSGTPEDRQRLTNELKTAPKRRVLYTDVGVNSGDSGGPLVNDQGQLIAVTFAMPSPDGQGRLGTTSYHIHLDDLKKFLANRPATPLIQTDSWPEVDSVVALQSLAGTGVPDTLIFAPDRQSDPSAFLIDLSQQTKIENIPHELNEKALHDNWRYQFALQTDPLPRAFYDTQGTGKIDLIVAGPDLDRDATSTLQLIDGQWKAVPAHGRIVDPQRFANPALRQKFITILKRLHP